MLVPEIVTASWKKQYSLFLHQIRTKLLTVLFKTKTGKPDGTCFGHNPGEQMMVGCKEWQKQAHILFNNILISGNDCRCIAQCHRCEKFAGGAIANGQIIFECRHRCIDLLVMGSDPAN